MNNNRLIIDLMLGTTKWLKTATIDIHYDNGAAIIHLKLDNPLGNKIEVKIPLSLSNVERLP